MPEKRDVRPSPLALTVLGVLAGAPLHPYPTQVRMKSWAKTRWANSAHRPTLYKPTERLHAAALITAHRPARGPDELERGGAAGGRPALRAARVGGGRRGPAHLLAARTGPGTPRGRGRPRGRRRGGAHPRDRVLAGGRGPPPPGERRRRV